MHFRGCDLDLRKSLDFPDIPLGCCKLLNVSIDFLNGSAFSRIILTIFLNIFMDNSFECRRLLRLLSLNLSVTLVSRMNSYYPEWAREFLLNNLMIFLRCHCLLRDFKSNMNLLLNSPASFRIASIIIIQFLIFIIIPRYISRNNHFRTKKIAWLRKIPSSCPEFFLECTPR